MTRIIGLMLILSVPGWAGMGLSACVIPSADKQNQGTTLMEKNIEEIAKQCYIEMYRAMMEKDSIGITEILDNSFILIHMTGMRQSKEEFIRAVLDGTLNYYTAEHEEIRLLAADEDNATMVGKTRVNAAVFGGGRYTWRLLQDIELVRRQGRWRIAQARASTY